jgi:hypothetical protein
MGNTGLQSCLCCSRSNVDALSMLHQSWVACTDGQSMSPTLLGGRPCLEDKPGMLQIFKPKQFTYRHGAYICPASALEASVVAAGVARSKLSTTEVRCFHCQQTQCMQSTPSRPITAGLGGHKPQPSARYLKVCKTNFNANLSRQAQPQARNSQPGWGPAQ